MASFPGQPGTRKVKSIWILMKQEMMGWQWHQLDHMQTIYTSLQIKTMPAHHDSTFYRPHALCDAQPSVKTLKAKALTASARSLSDILHMIYYSPFIETT